MKKLISALLAILMIVSCTACAKTAQPDAAQPAVKPAEANAKGQDAPAAVFPKGQITIVVPYSAGGASDTTTRIFASELEKALGTSVLVTNITGASGAVGLEHVKNSKPDGYTIAYMPVESTMLRALGFTDLSTNDFRFFGRAMTIPAAITVRAEAPWNTFEEFIQYSKENPEKILMGNSGTGSIWHIAAASVEKETGASFTHVPFEGAAPAVAALLGGNIDAVAVSPSEVKTNVDSGKFKALVVLGEDRSSVVPDVKTATELGVNVVIQGWGGFAVPAGTPDDIVATLEAASETAINSSAVKTLLTERGFEHAYLNGAEMDAKAKTELEYFSELIPSLGIVKK